MSSKPILLKEKPFCDMEGINIQIEPCKTYFSDGCVETAGTDETDLLREESKTNSIESTNNWPSWLFKQSVVIGYGALNTVDYLGESLANFFGITTPKYQFEINYHNNIMQEMNAEKVVNEENMKGWTQQPPKCIITAEPC
ncbi:protein FAM177A1-like isoform X1 [Metopolophium dirhodum]|uniref:protein FAM177A1-like isoform X1 n=2 Tax=Metopolophium dirhodum TaxID=44670 RepID=UPI00298FD7BB|nr:protein FAM177A1-like isoform X1 [Metopolophium dirhodum]